MKHWRSEQTHSKQCQFISISSLFSIVHQEQQLKVNLTRLLPCGRETPLTWQNKCKTTCTIFYEKKEVSSPSFFLKACLGKCPSLGSSTGCCARRGGHFLWLRRLWAAPGTEPAQQLKAPWWKMTARTSVLSAWEHQPFALQTAETLAGATAFNHQSINLINHLLHWGFYFIFAHFLKTKEKVL